MKKYQYQINDRVFAFDKGDYIVPGTITAMHDSLYRSETYIKPLNCRSRVSLWALLRTRAPASKGTGAVKSESDQGS